MAYVIGGFDGPSLDPEVLATADGVRFHRSPLFPRRSATPPLRRSADEFTSLAGGQALGSR